MGADPAADVVADQHGRGRRARRNCRYCGDYQSCANAHDLASLSLETPR
jgi:hypothetical protein